MGVRHPAQPARQVWQQGICCYETDWLAQIATRYDVETIKAAVHVHKENNLTRARGVWRRVRLQRGEG